jgi:hypothetical protein
MEQLCNNAYLFSDSFWKSGFAFKYAFVHWRPPMKTIGIPEKDDGGLQKLKAQRNYLRSWKRMFVQS